MAPTVSCSILELDLVGEALQIDVRPFPFDFPVHGEHGEERARYADRVRRSLTERGLCDGGAPTPELRSIVDLFGRGRWSIALVGTAGDRCYRVRASSDGQRAVIAQRQAGQVWFDPVTPEAMVGKLVDLLPATGAGRGGSVTVNARSTATTVVTGRQRAVAESILRRPRLGYGYFVVTRRQHNGREGRPTTLTWVDTDVGRYLIIPNGNGHITYLPADVLRTWQYLSRLFALAR